MDRLTNYRQFSTPKPLTTAGGIIPILGEGELLLTLPATLGTSRVPTTIDILLLNVLHVPHATEALVSLKCLLSHHGATLHATTDTAEVQLPYQRQTAYISLLQHKGVYFFPPAPGTSNTSPAQAHASTRPGYSGSRALLQRVLHACLGHVSLEVLKRSAKGLHLDFVPTHSNQTPCDICVDTKQTKTPRFNPHNLLEATSLHKSSTTTPPPGPPILPGMQLYLDIFGMPPSAGNRFHYVLLVVDHATRYVELQPMTNRDSPNIAAAFLGVIRRMSIVPLHCFTSVHSDQDRSLGYANDSVTGSTFNSESAFGRLLASYQIRNSSSNPHHSTQNGIAERHIRLVRQLLRSVVADSGFELSFWPQLIVFAIQPIVNLLVRSNRTKNPFELFFGSPFPKHKLHPIGSLAKLFVNPTTRLVEDKSRVFQNEPAAFVGYCIQFHAGTCHVLYVHRLLSNKQIVNARDVVFNDFARPLAVTTGTTTYAPTSPTGYLHLLDGIRHRGQRGRPRKSTSTQQSPSVLPRPSSPSQASHEEATPTDTPVQDTDTTTTPDVLRRSSRKTTEPDRLTYAHAATPQLGTKANPLTWDFLLTVSPQIYLPESVDIPPNWSEPRSIQKALHSCQFADYWLGAIAKEVQQLHENKTFAATPGPVLGKPLFSHFVFKFKRSERRFKCRLVVDGSPVDRTYRDTYSPTSMGLSVNLLLALHALIPSSLTCYDVSTAFLKSFIDETIHILAPKGLSFPHPCQRLDKSLYGLPTSPRLFYQLLCDCNLAFGLRQSTYDHCLYFMPNRSTNDIFALTVHIDDLFIISTSNQELQQYLQHLHNFGTGLHGTHREPSVFLGRQIYRTNTVPDEVHVTISHKIELLAKEFLKLDGKGNVRRKAAKRPTLNNYNLPPAAANADQSAFPYRSLVGSLLFLAPSRPDIQYAVSHLSRFNHHHDHHHHSAALHLLHYLYNTRHCNLSYPRKLLESDQLPRLTVHCDSTWASDDSRSSQYGWYLQLGPHFVQSCSKRDSAKSLSTCEAEYRACSEGARQLLCAWNTLQEMNLSFAAPPLLLTDSENVLNVLSNNVNLPPTLRHVEVRVHHLLWLIQEGKLVVTWVPSEENIADMLTKGLPFKQHAHLLSKVPGFEPLLTLDKDIRAASEHKQRSGDITSYEPNKSTASSSSSYKKHASDTCNG